MLLTSSVVGGLKVILGSFHCHVAQLVFLATPWAWPPDFDDDATSGEALKLYVQLIFTHAACGIVITGVLAKGAGAEIVSARNTATNGRPRTASAALG